MNELVKLIVKKILVIGEDAFYDTWYEMEEFEELEWEDIRYAYDEALDYIEEITNNL